MDTLFTMLDMILNAIRLAGYRYHRGMVKHSVKDCVCYNWVNED